MRLLGILIAVAANLAQISAQAREFHSSDVQPPDYPTVQAVAYMGKLIRERTGGRYSIGALGQDSQNSENFTIAEVRNGMLDMARVNVSPFNSTVSATIVPSLPFLFKSTAHTRRVLDGPIGEEILAALESQGFVGLCFYDTGARSFYSTNKPIRSAADMKGMNVRMPQSRIWVTMMQALGAKATPMSHNQVYAALASGTIDAAENNLPAYAASRHYEAAKIYSLTEYTVAPSVLVFSKRVWDTLSQEDQAIIRAAAKESVPYMRKLWGEREALARRTVEAAGAQIITDVDKKSFSDILAPLRSVLLPDPELQGIVKRIQAAE
jgi:tripartite ATP-independent transporter DctP family solute receptor